MPITNQFYCPICKREFQSFRGLQTHQRVHNVTCTKCGVYILDGKIRRRKKSKRKFYCLLCDKPKSQTFLRKLEDDNQKQISLLEKAAKEHNYFAKDVILPIHVLASFGNDSIELKEEPIDNENTVVKIETDQKLQEVLLDLDLSEALIDEIEKTRMIVEKCDEGQSDREFASEDINKEIEFEKKEENGFDFRSQDEEKMRQLEGKKTQTLSENDSKRTSRLENESNIEQETAIIIAIDEFPSVGEEIKSSSLYEEKMGEETFAFEESTEEMSRLEEENFVDKHSQESQNVSSIFFPTDLSTSNASKINIIDVRNIETSSTMNSAENFIGIGKKPETLSFPKIDSSNHGYHLKDTKCSCQQEFHSLYDFTCHIRSNPTICCEFCGKFFRLCSTKDHLALHKLNKEPKADKQPEPSNQTKPSLEPKPNNQLEPNREPILDNQLNNQPKPSDQSKPNKPPKLKNKLNSTRCNLCGKVFKVKEMFLLDNHIEIHHLDDTECPDCREISKSVDDVTENLRVCCPICEKFIPLCGARHHLAFHKAIDPKYACKFCTIPKKVFDFLYDLILHYKEMHGLKIDNELEFEKERKEKCEKFKFLDVLESEEEELEKGRKEKRRKLKIKDRPKSGEEKKRKRKCKTFYYGKKKRKYKKGFTRRRKQEGDREGKDRADKIKDKEAEHQQQEQ